LKNGGIDASPVKREHHDTIGNFWEQAMPATLDPIAAEVADGLTKAGISFSPTNDGGLRVALPGGFGEFEIYASDASGGDSVCELVEYNWHTHDDPLELVLDVFAGRCHLIEEYSSGKTPRKYVTYDLNEIVACLPHGATYKVFNISSD
jgi:hypothetical protein